MTAVPEPSALWLAAGTVWSRETYMYSARLPYDLLGRIS